MTIRPCAILLRCSKDWGIGREGQATTEMVFIIPLLVFLAGFAVSVAYMCYQGVKVQAAANYAARVQGEERVAGGMTLPSIDKVNGMQSGQGQDTDPTQLTPDEAGKAKSDGDWNPDNVYAKYRQDVRNMFSVGERDHLFVPRPQFGNEIDQVKVVRVMQPPTLFGHHFNPVTVQATAYGAGDTNMYSLPREGCTSANCSDGNYFWQQSNVLTKGDDSSQTALGN